MFQSAVGVILVVAIVGGKPCIKQSGRSANGETKPNGSAPTSKMVAYAKILAVQKSIKLPPGYDQDFAMCHRFLDQHAK